MTKNKAFLVLVAIWGSSGFFGLWVQSFEAGVFMLCTELLAILLFTKE